MKEPSKSAQRCKEGVKMATVQLENCVGGLDGKGKEDKPFCLFILPYHNGRVDDLVYLLHPFLLREGYVCERKSLEKQSKIYSELDIRN